MEWTKRWGYEVRPTKAVGVHVLKDGRYLVHGKVSERGKKRTVQRVIEAGSLRDAQAERLAMLDAARGRTSSSMPLFAAYAPSLYERKVALRELKSAKTRERWDTTLRVHLLPAFGRFRVDEITKVDVEQWKLRVAKSIVYGKSRKLRRGRYSPNTANGWLSILCGVLRSAVDDYQLGVDPTLRVNLFPVSEHSTYTDEDPNSLTPVQTRRFLREMRTAFPSFYAMTVLGFVTGLRPSTLRALRRTGPEADIDWRGGTLKVRRSNSLGREVMNTTKTDNKYTLGLSKDVVAILWKHVKGLKGKKAKSDLLFPGRCGTFLARSALDRPFREVSEAIGLSFALTPRGMRRTFQDIARDVGIKDKLQKAICGHESDKMTKKYSTFRPAETAKAVGQIASRLKVA